MAQINAGPIITPDQALGQDPNIGLNQQFEREQAERISLRDLKERRKINEANIALSKDQLELDKKRVAVEEMIGAMEVYMQFKSLGEDAAADAILRSSADAIAKGAELAGLAGKNRQEKADFRGTAFEAVATTDFGNLTEEQFDTALKIGQGMIDYNGLQAEIINEMGVDYINNLNQSKREDKDTRSTKEKGFATIARIGIEAFKKKTNEYEAFKQAKGDQRFRDQLAAQLMQAELQYIDDPDKAKIKVDAILREIFGDTGGTEEISIDDLR